VAKTLETIDFDPSQFEKELEAFGDLLRSKQDLSEQGDIQPFFKKSKHLSAYMGTYGFDIGVATDLAFEYLFFGDFRADMLLGNKEAREFCVVEFEDGGQDSIFKKKRGKANPEWSPRFDHGFSQMVDWFYNLDDFKRTEGFAKTFGYGQIKFIGLLIIGRSASLDETQRNRLKWRTEKVLIDSHQIYCITFDELYEVLKGRFSRYRAGWKVEKKKKT
jgi:hypothetical protein